jgi:hypothetical protein
MGTTDPKRAIRYMVAPGGLMRCCTETVADLARTARETGTPYTDGAVFDCKYEPEGNARIVLDLGVFRWNREDWRT